MDRRRFLTGSALVVGTLAVAPQTALSELTKEAALNPADYMVGPALPAWLMEHWYPRFVRCMNVFIGPANWVCRESPTEAGTIDLAVPRNSVGLVRDIIWTYSPVGVQWKIEEQEEL